MVGNALRGAPPDVAKAGIATEGVPYDVGGFGFGRNFTILPKTTHLVNGIMGENGVVAA